MKAMLKILVAGLSLGLAANACAQAPLTISEVKQGLYVIMGSGGNVGLRVTSEGAVLIDDKFPQNFDEIQSLVASVTDQPVKYVINTHHHGDHTGSNAGYIAIAEIIAHKNARANMIRGDQAGPPEIVFSQETAVFLGNIEVRAYHFGTGHTNGDAVIYFPDLKTIHGGDLLHTTAPFIDYANGGSSRGWVTTLNGILGLDFDTAIPGHGEVIDRAGVVAFRNQMEAVRERMKSLVRGGMPAGEAAVRIKDQSLSWTMADTGLFMQRSIPGFFEEIRAELQP
ncbi:MAG: hypothetical protein RLZZ385_1524 [Pseudomonadota bacterium]|jgi:glyoxylase-like metal-dependent hydrolase (beta-lactamase superfamily II)